MSGFIQKLFLILRRLKGEKWTYSRKKEEEEEESNSLRRELKEK